MLFGRDPHFWGSLFCFCVGYAVIANVSRLRTKKNYSAAYKQNSSEIFSCKYFQNPWHIKTAMLDYNQYMSCHTALLRGLFGKGLASHWWWDASPFFISSYCAFYGARNAYVCTGLSPDGRQSGYWTGTEIESKLRSKLHIFHSYIHASLPKKIVSIRLGAINKDNITIAMLFIRWAELDIPPAQHRGLARNKSWTNYTGIFCKLQDFSFDILC